MTQRLALAATAGLVAFVIVLLSAVGAYVLLAPPTAPTGLPLAAPPQGQTADASGAVTNGGAANGPGISADAAAAIALNTAPGATLVQRPRLVTLNGSAAYEVALDTGFVYIDASTGQVLYNGTSGNGQNRP